MGHWAKIKISRVLSFFGDSRGAYVFLHFLASRGVWCPSLFKASNGQLSLSYTVLLSCWLSGLFQLLRSGNYTGPTPVIQDNLPTLRSADNPNFICNLNSPLPCNKTYSQVLGIERSVGWGTLFCLPQVGIYYLFPNTFCTLKPGLMLAQLPPPDGTHSSSSACHHSNPLNADVPSLGSFCLPSSQLLRAFLPFLVLFTS